MWERGPGDFHLTKIHYPSILPNPFLTVSASIPIPIPSIFRFSWCKSAVGISRLRCGYRACGADIELAMRISSLQCGYRACSADIVLAVQISSLQCGYRACGVDIELAVRTSCGADIELAVRMSRVCPDMEKSKFKERVRIGGPGRQGLRSSSRKHRN
jgi:hypothetical protein